MIEYRALTALDAEKIELLERKCFSDPWTDAMIRGALLSQFFCGYGAFEGVEVVGFVFGTVIFEDAEIDDVAVAAEYRRRGVARELLKLTEEEAKRRGADRVFLEVRVHNLPATELYVKCGYRAVRRREKYYPDGEDAFVMAKRLTEEGQKG